MSADGSGATIENLIAQMSRGTSVLNGWDAVLNIDEDLVNIIFQAQFKQSARPDWKSIQFAFCQVFPNPGGGKLALYTGVNMTLATPSLKFLGNNEAFVEVSFQATGRTGTASKVVPVTFDPKKDCNPDDSSLAWDYTSFSQTAFTGKVPLSAVTGTPRTGDGVTQFVIDFPSGSFNSPAFNSVKDPDELRLRLKSYLETHEVQYVISSIRTDLAEQIPQMAPKAFRIAVLTTNSNRNVFQIFIATQNPAGRNLTLAVNEPVPDGYSLSAMFNKNITGQLGTRLMVQAWLFLQSNLVFPGRSTLSLGPGYTPDDALILGILTVDTSSSITPIEPINPQKERPMLNIQKTKQITPDGQPAFTAYGDDVETNVWYVPPRVVWATNPASKLPQLSLIQYNLTGGAVKGFCRLAVQLMIDPVQSDALKKAIPGASIGQFDWISSQAVFTYTVEGKSTSVQGTPSGFGSQVVTFSVPLPDDKAIAAFVNAFSKSGSASGTFGISYELAAETRLPAVTVVSRFDSTTAYQYQVENRYRTETRYHTDTWGNRRSEQVQVYVGTFVHEMLQQSQAAKVTVTPGKGLTPALLSMVEAWANTQLQKDVEQAVNNALSLIRNPTGNFSMNSVAGFTHTLETSNVVPWYFQVEGTLAPVDAETWRSLKSEVNEQQLQVTFEIQEALASHGISRINLKFQYGTEPPAIHTFDAKSSEPWYITMPGIFEAGKFKSSYQYQYEVIYAAPAGGGQAPPPLSTGWITDTATTVAFGLVQLGLLAVTFSATNISWYSGVAGSTPGVKEITVAWNWIPGGGGPVLVDTVVLTSQTPSVMSTLRSTGPTSNQNYQYSLTFLMSDGTKLRAVGLGGTSPLCRIDAPLSTVSVGVLPLFSDSVKAVVLRATFDDEKNAIHLSKQWVVKATGQGGKYTLDTAAFTNWDFQTVVANLNMATVVFSGSWVDGSNKPHTIPNTLIVGTNNTLMISDTQKMVTAVIDASNVPFVPAKTDGVYRVVALVADSEATPPPSDDMALANAKTIQFGLDTPTIQYYPTDYIDMPDTPTFYFQYIFTVNKNNGAQAQEISKWDKPQHTISTALPVIPGNPTAEPLLRAAAAVAAVMEPGKPYEDPRTRALFAMHNRFSVSCGPELELLLQA